MQRNSMRENRETPVTPVQSAGRSEKPVRYTSEAHVIGQSSDCIVPTKCPNKHEGSWAEGTEGRRSAKEDPKHGPVLDTEPENTGALPCRGSMCRLELCLGMPSSKVRAVCVRSASTGLCGGQRVTAVPTATPSRPKACSTTAQTSTISGGRSASSPWRKSSHSAHDRPGGLSHIGRLLILILLCASAVPAQTLESLAQAYRETPIPARRDALLRFANARPKHAQGALALLTVGVTEVEKGNHEEGIRRLKTAKPRLPKLGDYISYHVASGLYGLKQHAAAAGEVEPVWKASSPLAGRAALLAARAYLESGAPAKALEPLKRQQSRLPQPEGDTALAAAQEATGDLAAAAVSYQRVYHRFPRHPSAAEASAALKRLEAALGRDYPAPMPQLMLERAGKLADAGQFQTARAEYQALTAKLGGAERDLARVRVGVVDYLRRHNLTAYQYLRSLKPQSPDADAERLYYLVACARRLDQPDKMREHLDELARRHPKSEWRLEALIWAGNHYLLENDAASYEPLYRACYESFPSSPRTSYCHWKVAWTAYIQRRSDAEALFREHLEKFPDSVKASAGLYFLGRLAEKMGNPRAAAAYYGKILDHFSNHYYAVQAEERLAELKWKPVASVKPEPVLDGAELRERKAPESFRPSPATRSRIERARVLDSCGLTQLAERELRFEADLHGQPHILALELAETASRRGAADQAIRYIKALLPDYLSLPVEAAPERFWRLAFPLPFRRDLEKYSQQRDLDPFLIAGLIRQESEFNPKAVSPARAYGLTQILPSTGRQLTRKLRLGSFRTSLLLRPDFNLRLGTYYFRTLLDTHEGSLEAALASFNGGKSRVDTWLTWAPFEEPGEFIETIPFTETRNYVQSVLRNAAMYRRLYAREASEVKSANGPPRRTSAVGAPGA